MLVSSASHAIRGMVLCAQIGKLCSVQCTRISACTMNGPYVQVYPRLRPPQYFNRTLPLDANCSHLDLHQELISKMRTNSIAGHPWARMLWNAMGVRTSPMSSPPKLTDGDLDIVRISPVSKGPVLSSQGLTTNMWYAASGPDLTV